MKILRIKLENIKSYEDGPGIDLHQGVNFISGKNGSGKTTLLESIGYGIFDACNYSNISKMLREGTKSGKIIIWFSFDDDIVYRSERKISTSSSTWTIYEESDETEIVSGSKETLSWIKEMMGLPEEVNISQMYSDIIGVSQGEITTYFKLSSEAKRKEHFNPMIGVEDYKNAYSQTSSIHKTIINQIQEIGSQIAQINIRTEKYNEKKDELENIKSDLIKIQKESENKDSELKLNQKQLKVKENIKDELKNEEKELGIVVESIENYETNKKKINESVLEAGKASSVIDKTSKGYEAYKKASDKYDDIDKKRKEKNKLEDERNSLLTELKSIETEIKSTRKYNLSNEIRIKENIKNENKKISEISLPYKKNVSKLEEVDKNLALIKETEEEHLDEINNTRGVIKNNLTKISGNDAQIKKKNFKIMALKKEIVGISELGKIKSLITELRNTLQKKESKTQTIIDAIESYEDSISKGGICPILNESCKRVSKDVLSQKITEFRKEQNKIELEIKPIQKKLEDLEKKEDNLIALKTKKEQIEEESDEMLDLEKENKELKSEIQIPEINSLIKNLNSRFKSLKISVELKKVKSLGNIIENLKQVYEISKQAIKEYEKVKNVERTNIEKIKTGYETKITRSKEVIQELEDELDEVSTSKKELEIKIKQTTQNKKLLKEIQDKLEPLVGIEKDISKLSKIIDDNKKNYDAYKENIKESENLGKLKNQLNEVSRLLNEKILNKSSIEKKISVLKRGYNEEDHKKLKDLCDKLMKEKTIADSKLQQFEKDNKELIKIIKEMENELTKIKKLEDEKNKIDETGKLINLIRKILNEVGKPIAQRYLDSLSASANMIYNTLSDEKVILTWESDYMIKLTDAKGTRDFIQLSGGEQMCAALSVQLALAKEFSNVGIAIFDEPTSNLDETRRDFLSETISKVKEEYGFNQLFIISHDETFSSLTEQEIHLEKINGKTNLT